MGGRTTLSLEREKTDANDLKPMPRTTQAADHFIKNDPLRRSRLLVENAKKP
jgi:hypothetical protein